MKPHKILHDYRYRQDFPTIARNAAAWVDLHPNATADDLLEWADSVYGKMDIVRRIPNLRKISMSPWVDQENGAAQIGSDFVFSRKPSPAFLAVDAWSPEAVASDLQQTIETCERHSSPLELILKDISTVRYQPHRLWEWADIAMDLVGA